MVAVIDGEEVEPVERQKGQLWKFIEIDGEHENPVIEGMFRRRDAGVIEAALVEERSGGAHVFR